MLNAMLVRTILSTFLVSAALPPQPIAGELAAPPPSGETEAVADLKIPDDGAAVLVVGSPLLAEIANWVSENFDIPASASLPDVEIASPERFTTVRYRRLVEGQQSGAIPGLGDQPPSNRFSDVVAFYENASQTIFLREGWKGSSPTDVSVLVHEMVHHLQNVAGMAYGCPAAREKLAYAAQQKWLALSGRDFFEEFETDRMTLLVRTSCGF